MAGRKDPETRWYEERDELFRSLRSLDRRSFMKVAAAAAGAALVSGVDVNPTSFTTVRIADAATTGEAFTFAYISDSHLYKRELNDRFVNSLMRAVDDVNRMDPQPDFILYGGDLAQLGQPEELDLGAQILKNLKAPVRMMVGEHDWFLDLGEKWKGLFGQETYSFDHKGVHFVVLMSVNEKDFWTERKMTPMERMLTVAGLDNGTQSRFEVGAPQREWLKQDLAKVSAETPIIVFSHSPLYHYYENWNFWTVDAPEVQALLKKFKTATVIHGHTHQMLTNRIGNIHFHGMLSTAWPWPYAPEGLPGLTIQMNRPDPFDPNDGCGDGQVNVLSAGLVDKVYNLWNRNPVVVPSAYLASNGKKDRPPTPTLTSF
ncbi:MAG TPA: metallophosphoesterase [Candidatus Binatia bacterium]|jgi:3',5'-cyclic AMP phosphodiesterase CpdA|nr:metallophosphoesterase [Candidatus Binatia bacterium]